MSIMPYIHPCFIQAQVLELAKQYTDGKYLAVLQSPLVGHLLGSVTASEAAVLAPQLCTLDSVASLLRSRLCTFLFDHEGDSYLDAPGSIDTPAHYRAVAVLLLAMSCLSLFTQATYTGPDLTAAETDAAQGLAFAQSLLGRSETRDTAPATGVVTAAAVDAETALASATSSGSAAAATAAAPSDADDDLPDPAAVAAAGGAPLSPLQRACLDALRMEGSEAYELLPVPLLLVTARALMQALSPAHRDEDAIEEDEDDSAGGGGGGALPASSAGINVLAATRHREAALELKLEDSKRRRKIGKVTSQLYAVSWAAARCVSVHQRSLVDKQASLGLWREARQHFSRACGLVCPGLEPAFADGDELRVSVLQCAMSSDPLADVMPSEGDRRSLRARLLLEWGMVQHHFDRTIAAKTSFLLAKRESGLRVAVTGALGRRTKYQETFYSQLVVQAASSQSALSAAAGGATTPGGPVAAGNTVKPAAADVTKGIREVSLTEIDVKTHLLEKVELKPADASEKTSDGSSGAGASSSSAAGAASSATFTTITPPALAGLSDGEDVVDGALTPLDQCILLALCIDIKNNNPADGLTNEQMRPFVARTLESPQGWLVHSTGLLIKSWLEFEGHRTAERAVLQLQALIDQHSNKLTALQSRSDAVEAGPPAASRLCYLHCLAWPPRWDLIRQCADRYKKLGAVRAALTLYEDLCLWDDIIACHITLDRVKRAEALVRRRLAVSPTPYMWCMLGLVTDSDEPYEHARQAGNGRYARADLALGKRRFQRGDMEGCIECLQRGLRQSPGSEKEWFLLGVVAMRLERWETALEGFSRTVQLDNTRSDAWANLGAIHLHLCQWDKGYSSYEQAVKADKRDWRIWSNFLVAAIRTKNYSRAITVMHTLVDLHKQRGPGADADSGGEGVDVQCLGVLVTQVVKSIRAAATAGLQQQPALAATSAHHVHNNNDDANNGDNIMPAAPTSLDMDDDDDTDRLNIHQAVDLPTDQPGLQQQQTPSPNASSQPGDAADDDDQQQYLDAAGVPASHHLEATAKLLGHITSAISRVAPVWQLYAMLEDARGRPSHALECRLRQCRAMQSPGWEKDAKVVEGLAMACKAVVDGYLSQGTATAIEQARMHVTTLIRRVESGDAPTRGTPGHVQLQEVLASIPPAAVQQ